MSKFFFIFLFGILNSAALNAIESSKEITTIRIVKSFKRAVPWQIILPVSGEGEVDLQIQADLIFVQAMIDEAGPYRFLVDTGSNTSILSHQLVHQLNLVPHENNHSIFETGQGKTTIDTYIYIIKHLKLGNAIIKHMPLVAVKAASNEFKLLADLNVSGILGMNVFHDIILTINLTQHKIKLTNHENFKETKYSAVKYANKAYIPVVTAQVLNGQIKMNYPFLIDSGFNGFIKMPVCIKQTATKDQDDKVMTYDAFHQEEDGVVKKLVGIFTLGEKTLAYPEVIYPVGKCVKPIQWGLIGTQFLKEQTVSFDQKNRRLILHH